MSAEVKRFTVKAERRTGKTRNISRKAYVGNFIPAVIYNKDENIAVTLNRHDFEKMMPKLRANSVLDIVIDGEHADMVICDHVYDVKKNVLEHLDFYKLKVKTPLNIKIPIELKGLAEGLKKGGLIRRHTTTLRVRCLPEDIPVSIDLDITHLDTDEAIFVRDLPSLEGFKDVPYRILSSPDQAIVSITVSSKAASTAAQEKGGAEKPAEGAKDEKAVGETSS